MVTTLQEISSPNPCLIATATAAAGPGTSHLVKMALIPLCILMDKFEWQETYAGAKQSL